jgi:hypothetical protein
MPQIAPPSPDEWAHFDDHFAQQQQEPDDDRQQRSRAASFSKSYVIAAGVVIPTGSQRDGCTEPQMALPLPLLTSCAGGLQMPERDRCRECGTTVCLLPELQQLQGASLVVMGLATAAKASEQAAGVRRGL